MRSTEAPVRSRACSSSLRAWRSSHSLSGTGFGDTGHQRKAAGSMAAYERLDGREPRATVCGTSANELRHHTKVTRRDQSCARIQMLARASEEVEKRAFCRGFREWRDPDSNRGHHDF